MEANPALSLKELAQKTLQANKEHQYALKVYTERLEDELGTVNKLLDAADVAQEEDDIELDVGGSLHIPGAIKVLSPVALDEFLSKDSPFYADAQRRQRYLHFTSLHSMKAKELDTLAESVRSENHRKYAYDAQQRGEQAFVNLKDFPEDFFLLNKEGLDWERIAEQVSSASFIPRSAKECQIRWLGNRHPENNHSPWSQAEISQLRGIVDNLPPGGVDWIAVANELQTRRTPLDCMRHAMVRRPHTFTPESDGRLLHAVGIYGSDNWSLVARYVSEDATASQCQNRYNRTLDPTLKRGIWSLEESERLRLAVAAYGKSWVEVSLLVPGRSSDQCREHWLEKANPDLSKGKWTDEDDQALLDAVDAVGKNWKDVAEYLDNGRSENMCRMRYSNLSKRPQELGESSTSMFSTQPVPARELRAKGKSKRTAGPEAVSSAEPSTPEITTAVGGLTDKPPKPRPKPRPKNKGKAAAASHSPEVMDSSQVLTANTSPTAASGAVSSTTAPTEDMITTARKRAPTRDRTITADSSNPLPKERARLTKKARTDKDTSNHAETSSTNPENDSHIVIDQGVEESVEGVSTPVAVEASATRTESSKSISPKKAPREKPIVVPTRRQPTRAATRKVTAATTEALEQDDE